MENGDLNSAADEPVSHNSTIRKRVILRKGDVPSIMQVARVTFPPGEIAGAHAHPDMWELFFCEAGCGIMTVESRQVPLTPGAWVMVRPGEVHEVANPRELPLILHVTGVAGASSPR
jgi:mannose-6-phosphate isomerase-like protein (cupin superfamily)